ncbi:MAG: hypothetical protein ACJATN_000569 [Neolewinella sp.]|jgi:hypothetical protein
MSTILARYRIGVPERRNSTLIAFLLLFVDKGKGLAQIRKISGLI